MFIYDWSFPRSAYEWPITNGVTYLHHIENGPCQVNADGKTTVLNPFRFVYPLWYASWMTSDTFQVGIISATVREYSCLFRWLVTDAVCSDLH